MARSRAGPSVQPVAFDTDVLIHYLRGHAGAAEFLRATPYLQRRLPAVAYMELLQGAKTRREAEVIGRDVRRNFAEVVPIDSAITGQAIRLINRHGPTDGLRVADALIAATVLGRGFRLATANERHYRPIHGMMLDIFRP